MGKGHAVYSLLIPVFSLGRVDVAFVSAIAYINKVLALNLSEDLIYIRIIIEVEIALVRMIIYVSTIIEYELKHYRICGILRSKSKLIGCEKKEREVKRIRIKKDTFKGLPFSSPDNF